MAMVRAVGFMARAGSRNGAVVCQSAASLVDAAKC